ncbi:hypothetical protein BTR14_16565 [Rhizobium rhizosphaerae]|uniref:DUF2938 domain-containing protein n=1 Tax=Xaviernesmea rhizosphaerae TaxID=1672749 RepID=A0ABX3PB99_9HYPH|nr:DUF2938 domain-containing protein [Xaviernesmea rhizosphaerae]OQP85248.1 hypothetical protein BTR14_16565 [Xaviernesmea rhizosphaerae]
MEANIGWGEALLRGAVIGIGATVLMDLWGLLLARLGLTGAANWAPVGRWFWHLKSGRIFHADIAAATPFAGENALGWAGHYAVGLAYGVLLLVFTGPGWLSAPTLLPALLWGVVTVAAGWFLLQPGLGLGIAAARTPQPGKVRLLNLAAHIVFGLGLWLSALLTA